MPWTPAYNLVSIERLASNLLAIFKRDQVAALEWASPSERLQPFMYFGIARRVDAQIMPQVLAQPVVIGPMAQSPEEAAVQMRQEISILVSSVGSDPEKLAREVLTRTRAVVNMVFSASPMDIFEGVTTGAFGGLVWDIQQITPDRFPRQSAQGQYMSQTESLAVFNYIET